MAKCPNCNKTVAEKDKFCKNCGEDLKEEKTKSNAKKTESEIFNKIGDNLEKILDTEDTSKDYSKKDINNNKGLAVLSYIGPLALIPYFKDNNSKYVKYHAVQGMNLLIVWIIYTIISSLLYLIKFTKSCNIVGGLIINCEKVTPWWVKFPVDIAGLILFALSIIGIVYVLTDKAKKIPLIDKVNIIK